MLTHWLASPGPLSVILLVVLALAVWFDVGELRIPNRITAGGFTAALLARALLGPEALGAGLMGGGLGLTLGLLFFAAGAMGAGDGKLLAAVGACLGLQTFLLCLPLIGAFGGMLALVVTARSGTLMLTLRRFRELLFYFVTFGRIGALRTLSTPGSAAVPYGVAVAAGAAMAWLGWGVTV